MSKEQAGISVSTWQLGSASAKPKCPHCGSELATIQLYSWLVPGFVILGTFCGEPPCRVLLHTQVIPANMVDRMKTDRTQ